MEKNYQHCLEMILHHEGGYVNHPEDPGGATNLGVTKIVYEEWVGRTVTLDKMEQLQVSDVAPIYKKNYWNRVKGDQLPSGLDLCVFDFGVNAGTGRAAKYLQKMVGATSETLSSRIWSKLTSLPVHSSYTLLVTPKLVAPPGSSG